MRPLHPRSKEQILTQAIPLFARMGFDGISMRDIAGAVGMSAAALYHHFPDKQTLYLRALTFSIQDKLQQVFTAVTPAGTTREQLHAFVERLLESLEREDEFRMLIERELLTVGQNHLPQLVEQVFQGRFQELLRLVREVEPDLNPYTLFLSLVGLAIHEHHIGAIRRTLTGVHGGAALTRLDLTERVLAHFFDSIAQRPSYEIRRLPRYV
ncbi:MAG: TetR/AcrR family transcriptional regulator [Magnetococcales bacterium]|nr:TetR/AcrR family transcriptional regulator [Magnetococcales bacterium]